MPDPDFSKELPIEGSLLQDYLNEWNSFVNILGIAIRELKQGQDSSKSNFLTILETPDEVLLSALFNTRAMYAARDQDPSSDTALKRKFRTPTERFVNPFPQDNPSALQAQAEIDVRPLRVSRLDALADIINTTNNASALRAALKEIPLLVHPTGVKKIFPEVYPRSLGPSPG